MDFTIVTPSYNYGRYISECLESVAVQEGVTLEHLVMDAQSSDNTADVVARYPHASLFREPDKGMSDAINKGFKLAKGNWVMWLNADDRLKPGALSTVKEWAESHPRSDILYGCWNFIDEVGSFKRRMTLFPYSQNMMLYVGCYIGSTSTFLRKSTVIDEGHHLSIDFKYVMDGEYYARLGHIGKTFTYIPHVLADFRLHGGNLSKRNYSDKSVGGWLALQKQFAETRAYRRSYGIRLFSDENLNTLTDAFLYLIYRALKPVMKLIYKFLHGPT